MKTLKQAVSDVVDQWLDMVYKDLEVNEELDEKLNCGYECHFTKKYGFVPECGCPIHDIPKKIQ